MQFIPTELDGVYRIETKEFRDDRGAFVKVFHWGLFEAQGLSFNFKESYYSVSKKNVIRGMHFQIPPQDHAKLVYVTRGVITDVVLDIRRGSPTFGKYVSLDLSDQNQQMVFIPSGFAHGFLSREDSSAVTYLQTTMHSPDHDRGIRVDSFNFDWGVESPILSKRDLAFPAFKEFETPFVYRKNPT